MTTNSGQRRGVWRMMIGAIVGAAVGLIIAVNVVIFSGVEDGYEAAPADVFEQRPFAAAIAIVAFVLAIGAGITISRRS